MTSAGFLPPISMIDRARDAARAALSRSSFIPTSIEPVKTMPSMPSLSISSWPAVLPPPVTKLKTPSRQPGLLAHLVQLHAHPAASSLAGLNTTVLPATSAPPAGPAASASGKLNGEITAQTPYGRSTLEFSLVGAERAHLLLEAVVRLDLVAVVRHQVGRFFDVARRIRGGSCRPRSP